MNSDIQRISGTFESLSIEEKQHLHHAFNCALSSHELENSKGHVFTVEGNGDNYVAVMPEPLVEDFNYPFTTEAEAWSWLLQVREHHRYGKTWDIQANQKPRVAHLVYRELGDACVNQDSELEHSFLHFDKGTECIDVWHWIESTFDTSIAQLEGAA